MEDTMTKRIAHSCGISERDAEREKKATSQYLQELMADDDLRYSDIENSMLELGLECDDPEMIFSLLLG